MAQIDSRPLAGPQLARAWSPRATQVALIGQFALFGAILGAQGVVWDAVKARLALGDGAFGTAMLVTPLVGFLVLLGGRWTGRAGDRPRTVLGLALAGLALLALAGAGGVWAFVGSRLLAGLSYGLLEGAVTGAALRWERATGGRLIGPVYAGLSVAMVVSSLAAGALLEAGVSDQALMVGLALAAVALAAGTAALAYPPAAGAAQVGPRRAGGQPVGRGLRALVWLCLLATLAEALLGSWSVIYLRGLGASPFGAGAAFALCCAAMVVGRLGAPALAAGRGAAALFGLAGAGVALAGLGVAQGSLALAVAAFALLGLAVAGVVPVALGAADASGAGHAAHNAILATTFLGFAVATPAVGWLAERFSMGPVLALSLIGLGAAIVWLARRAAPAGAPGK